MQEINNEETGQNGQQEVPKEETPKEVKPVDNGSNGNERSEKRFTDLSYKNYTFI